MPQNKNLKPVELPMELKFGQEPKTLFYNNLEHLEVELGYQSTVADPDVWRRPAVKSDGEAYYEYVLCYVDDILVISHDPWKIMNYWI